MKTSLNLDDDLFQSAKKEAEKLNMTLSDLISLWARKGRDEIRKNKKKGRRQFKTVKLGSPKIDLTKRKEWLEALEDS